LGQILSHDAPNAASLRSLVLRFAPLAAALALLAYHVAPMWHEPYTWAGGWDVRYFFFMTGVDKASIGTYHQLPLWNPFYCGGAPHLANPQASPLSPLTPLLVLFDLPIAFRLGYTAGLLTALLGMRAYARALGLSELASSVAGAGFAVCGALSSHMGGGHWSWMGFALYPLLLRSHFLATEGRRAHVVWGALVLAIIIYHSPIYPMAFAFVTLGCYGLCLGLQNGVRDVPRLRRALLSAGGILALGLALGGLRILPMGEFVAAHPRAVKDWDFTWPWELVVTYGIRHAERGFGSHQYVFPEYNNYFGFVGLALVLVGTWLVLARRRRLWPIVAVAVTCVVFQLGNLVPSPWWLLKHLPVYENLRVAARFTIVAGVFFCVLVGVVLDQWGPPALGRWRALEPRRRLAAGVVLVLAAAYLVDAASWNRQLWLPTFGSPPPADPHAAQFRQVAGDRGRMMAFPPANMGTLSCFEETPLDVSPRLRGDLPADEYLAEPDAGTVRRVSWSPNRIVLDVDVKRPATVLVNQNMGVGWRAEGATLVPKGVDGLIAARVEPGRHLVTFRYLPRSVLAGAAVSLLAAAGAAAFLIYDRQTRRRRAWSAAG